MKRLEISQMEGVNGGKKEYDFYLSAACGFGLGLATIVVVATGGVGSVLVGMAGATTISGCGALLLNGIHL